MMKRALTGAFFLAGRLILADDPVKVDNEFVHVVMAVEEPHQKTPLHEHQLNRLLVYLDKSDLSMTSEDGRVQRKHWKAGDIEWSLAGGRHVTENIGKSAVRIVEVELKKPAPKTVPRRAADLDPVAIDPKHNLLLLENDQLRALRNWREPGGNEAMHEHTGAGRVVVLLTDIDVRVKDGDGSEAPLHEKAGDVFWSGPSKHGATNIGKSKFEMILIEVK
jgi:hypothetical protein